MKQDLLSHIMNDLPVAQPMALKQQRGEEECTKSHSIHTHWVHGQNNSQFSEDPQNVVHHYL